MEIIIFLGFIKRYRLKKNKMGRKCSMNKIQEKYENLVVEYKQKIPFWRHRCRWKEGRIRVIYVVEV